MAVWLDGTQKFGEDPAMNATMNDTNVITKETMSTDTVEAAKITKETMSKDTVEAAKTTKETMSTDTVEAAKKIPIYRCSECGAMESFYPNHT